MIVVFVLVAALAVVAIALVAVGAVTGRLAGAPATSVFDINEAVHYVADRLPDDATATLSYDDVRALIGWHLDYLQERGVAGRRDDDLAARSSEPIVSDDEGVAYVLGRAVEAGLDVDDVAVVQVLEGESAYLEAIGAIGVEVRGPLDPEG